MSGARTSTSFSRPTIDQLVRQSQADINANLIGADARLAQNNLDVLAIVGSGLADEQFEAIDDHARQLFVTTCDGIWLDRHGAEWGIPRKTESYSLGDNEVTGTPLSPIPVGALFQTTDRQQFATTAPAVIGATGTVVVPMRAVVAGAAGNIVLNTQLTTVSPILGVMSARAFADFFGGAPRELDEPYRNRILDRIQRPPQGGAQHDYERWCLEYPGVTRAWVYPLEQGIGTVIIRFAMDNSYPDGIPTAGDAAGLLAYLEVRRPVTAELFVYIPGTQTIDITIENLQPRTPETELAVLDEMRDLFHREGEPGSIMRISWFWEAASIASGVRHHKIIVPPDDVFLPLGTMPILGTISYV